MAHDVLHLERRLGVPAVGIFTTGFPAQAAHQLEALGATQPERHMVLAAHPVSDRTREELAAIADGLCADLERMLTQRAPCSQARITRMRAQRPSAACDQGG